MSGQSVSGPASGSRVTEGYARMVARDMYFWAWPMINMYTRRRVFGSVTESGLIEGILPVAPVNRLTMATDYLGASQRAIACPNQDVVYGAGLLGLDIEPVVVQVPDFGDRFWLYQVCDVRTDGFAELGAMYGTAPGFYLLVGPDWSGDVPEGIAAVFRAPSNSGLVGPRIFQDDTAADRAAVQGMVSEVDCYPLSMFDGVVKRRDWRNVPSFPSPKPGGAGEMQWVRPETFVDELPQVLADAPPLPGEQARYAQALALVDAVNNDPHLRAAIADEAARTDAEVVSPLLQFRNFGIPLPHGWSTIENGCAFGTDYLTRTAVARSNILVNRGAETAYFYQDLDAVGGRLNGAQRYTVIFDPVPPVRGFWSLTLYDEHHFFVPNPIERYSVGTKNTGLCVAADSSLTIYVQAEEPTDPEQRANWLPAPAGADFSLFVRAYWPEPDVIERRWTPPAVQPAD